MSRRKRAYRPLPGESPPKRIIKPAKPTAHQHAGDAADLDRAAAWNAANVWNLEQMNTWWTLRTEDGQTADQVLVRIPSTGTTLVGVAGATGSGENVTAVGYHAADGNTHNSVIAIGKEASPTKANQAILGGVKYYVNALTILSGATGGALEGTGKSSSTDGMAMARVAWQWNVSTHATRTADIILHASDYSAEREILRGRGTGAAPSIGFLGTAPVVKQLIADAAVDLSTVITLANDIRTALNNYGLTYTGS